MELSFCCGDFTLYQVPVYSCFLFFCLFVFYFPHSAKSAEAAKRQNMKKESKAYSYEDQIWEMELREVCCHQTSIFLPSIINL